MQDVSRDNFILVAAALYAAVHASVITLLQT